MKTPQEQAEELIGRIPPYTPYVSMCGCSICRKEKAVLLREVPLVELIAVAQAANRVNAIISQTVYYDLELEKAIEALCATGKVEL